ncbi:hypothetical protein Psfp_00497 [Pelotomaculum sp. FP]|uniref:hypothetical protein n=1 Tax=Pelotomaculum sp. FP TaxID=261474 RepID=UPI001065B749|nr:hypothetical protein [Pelotomaculum sp. FP]TEB17625.1 hypothetical protein Psfp_00497 [Pelotomaculum sp. FP]
MVTAKNGVLTSNTNSRRSVSLLCNGSIGPEDLKQVVYPGTVYTSLTIANTKKKQLEDNNGK